MNAEEYVSGLSGEDAVVELPETDEELLQLVGGVITDPATDQEQQQEEKLVNVDTSTKRGLQLVNELQLY